jgi:hypothetical protein
MPILAHLKARLKWRGENTSPVKLDRELPLIAAGKLDPLDYSARRGRMEFFAYQNYKFDWRLSVKYCPNIGPSIDLFASEGFKDLDEVKEFCENTHFIRMNGITDAQL